MRRIIVMMCVFLSIVLFSGCSFTPPAEESRDASSRVMERRATSPSSKLLINPEVLDDLSFRAGIGTRRDSGVELEPIGRALTANTCHGELLPLSPELQIYAREGYSLWHLCYETPTRGTSTDPLASARPTSVVVSVFHEPSRTLREILRVEPASSSPTNSWIMSALLILSPHTRPFFFVENRYASGTRLGALSESPKTGDPIIHGELHMWHVDAEGRQEASVPGVGVVCSVASSADETHRYTFFIPHLACLGGFESCRLATYDCRDMLSLPF